MSHSEIKERENGGRGGAVRIFDTIAHEFCFFFVGEGIALLGLVAWQYDFRHGRGNFEIVRGDVEDTAQEVGKFFRGAIFAFSDESEQIILQFVAIDVFQKAVSESGKKIFLEESVVFLESGRLDEILFDF